MVLRLASPCMNDRVCDASDGFAVSQMQMALCQTFPASRRRSLTFPKLSLRDNLSVRDGFLRIVPPVPPPPSSPFVCRKMGNGSPSTSAKKFCFFAMLRFPLSFSLHFHRSFCARLRVRRRNASGDLPAALPKTSLIFLTTGIEDLRTDDHGTCGILSS